MIDFWNERYAADAYAYGTLPNEFLKEQLVNLEPGSILFPAEGEGRNAVYAAKQGFTASAFDMSTAGRDKALSLAKSQNVALKFDIARLQDFDFGQEQFDAIAFIYVHMGPDIRSFVHQKAVKALKPNGSIILEAFSKDQLGNDSGGPKNIDWLFDADTLRKDFDKLEILYLEEKEINLSEGAFHSGKAQVTRFIGKKVL